MLAIVSVVAGAGFRDACCNEYANVLVDGLAVSHVPLSETAFGFGGGGGAVGAEEEGELTATTTAAAGKSSAATMAGAAAAAASGRITTGSDTAAMADGCAEVGSGVTIWSCAGCLSFAAMFSSSAAGSSSASWGGRGESGLPVDSASKAAARDRRRESARVVAAATGVIFLRGLTVFAAGATVVAVAVVVVIVADAALGIDTFFLLLCRI